MSLFSHKLSNLLANSNKRDSHDQAPATAAAQIGDPDLLPVFPLRNTVLYPHIVGPFSAGRIASIRALEAALASEQRSIAMVAQRDPQVEQPGLDDLFEIGTRATITRVIRSGEALEVVVKGIERIRLTQAVQHTPFLQVRATSMPVSTLSNTESEALQRELIAQLGQFFRLSQAVHELDLSELVRQFHVPLHLVYFLATFLALDVARAQKVLQADSQLDALRLLHSYMAHELEILEVRREVAGKVQSGMDRQQREMLLRRQLEAIQDELGDAGAGQSDLTELRERLNSADFPEPVRKEAERELNRLERVPVTSPDHQVTRTYLELILELPWQAQTQDQLDLTRARQILNQDHYGLNEIKERILEQLAVLKLKPDAKAPILCLVGPPGVGKTSLGQSIARALGRRFERLSLGGLHDESELRGHRRTYIGAMPGRIIQAMRRAGVRNPLLMFDEIDKLGHDFRGDPAAAMLEILDSTQNHAFRDNYLDLPFDLSQVFFITTANGLDGIPRSLLDRMEVIRLSSYSEQEKLEIARRYLLPRAIEGAGLQPRQLHLPDQTITRIISRYTREAGVRELQRQLEHLARKVALAFAEGHHEAVTVAPEDLYDRLGHERFFLERARHHLTPGVATGLAWTEAGGEVLFIESLVLPQREHLVLTGQLGEVMQESARTARSFIFAHSQQLGIDQTNAGLHIHVPAGTIAKDGPSAGATIATAIASLYSGQAVRSDTAMTGEITLTGLLLPVGGIKEKVLAARRAGISRVILPAQNEKDLDELPAPVRQEMTFILAADMTEVLDNAIPGLAGRLTHA